MPKFKFLALSLLLSLLCASLWAKRVDVESAEKVVRRHVESKHGQFRDRERGRVNLQHTSFKKRKHHRQRDRERDKPGTQATDTDTDTEIDTGIDTDTVCYYVFNINDDDYNGFVIVAGDDAAMPVLGYSDNSNYDENNLAPAFVEWMEFLQEEI